MSSLFCSQRLKVRPLRDGDLDWFASMQADLAVMSHSAQPVQNLAQSIELLRQAKKQIELKSGYCLWAIENEFKLGIGIVVVRLNEQGSWVIGYQFAQRFWWRGYATELIPNLLVYLTRHLPQQMLHAYVLSENKASCRVLEKSGFTLQKEQRNSKIQALTRHYRWGQLGCN